MEKINHHQKKSKSDDDSFENYYLQDNYLQEGEVTSPNYYQERANRSDESPPSSTVEDSPNDSVTRMNYLTESIEKNIGLKVTGKRSRDHPPADEELLLMLKKIKSNVTDVGTAEKQNYNSDGVVAIVNESDQSNKIKSIKIKFVSQKSAPPIVEAEAAATPPPPVNNINIEKRYKCTICGISFTSFRALGGHKSSHTVRVKREGSTSTSTSPSIDAVAAAALLKKVEKSSNQLLLHGCDVCGRRFETNRALKMHQRIHDHQYYNKSPTMVRNFDLNQPPAFLDQELDS